LVCVIICNLAALLHWILRVDEMKFCAGGFIEKEDIRVDFPQHPV